LGLKKRKALVLADSDVFRYRISHEGKGKEHLEEQAALQKLEPNPAPLRSRRRDYIACWQSGALHQEGHAGISADPFSAAVKVAPWQPVPSLAVSSYFEQDYRDTLPA
jgi:hypothetical protein